MERGMIGIRRRLLVWHVVSRNDRLEILLPVRSQISAQQCTDIVPRCGRDDRQSHSPVARSLNQTGDPWPQSARAAIDQLRVSACLEAVQLSNLAVGKIDAISGQRMAEMPDALPPARDTQQPAIRGDIPMPRQIETTEGFIEGASMIFLGLRHGPVDIE